MESSCQICNAKSEDIYCSLCNIIVPHVLGHRYNIIYKKEYIDKIRDKIGFTSMKPQHIWEKIRKMDKSDEDIRWVDLNYKTPDFERNIDKSLNYNLPKWSISKECMDFLDSYDYSESWNHMIRDLQIGGLLPDNSHLCWMRGSFYLDGKQISIPYRGLMKMINNKQQAKNIDWKKLLYSIEVATNVDMARYGPSELENSRLHPMLCLHELSTHKFLSWAHFRRRSSKGEKLCSMRRINFTNAEWIERWNNDLGNSWLTSNGKNLESYAPNPSSDVFIPTALSIENGRLNLRVRRDDRWEKIEIRSKYDLWARMVTWALSPPWHRDHRLLICIQNFIFTEKHNDLIIEHNKRGIIFLNDIVRSNDRVCIDPDDQGSYMVTGASNLKYSVQPTKSMPKKRFMIYADKPTSPGDIEVLCIDESPELKKLVIGDAVATIILALLDDLKSREKITNLDHYLDNNMLLLDDELVNEELDENIQIIQPSNRLLTMTNRYTLEFPSLWGVLLRRPLGERITFTAMNNKLPNIYFDGCFTAFITKSNLDRQVIYRMLEASGWIRDIEEEKERETQRIYIRIGTGARNLGEEIMIISNMLEPRMLNANMVRVLNNPLWSYFERKNPGIGELRIRTNQLIDYN